MEKEADAGRIQWGFSGVSTFAHLKHTKCLTSTDTLFDIAVLGVPFDTAVSYRPGMSFPLPAKLIPFLLPSHSQGDGRPYGRSCF
jgi:hypothetical protein